MLLEAEQHSEHEADFLADLVTKLLDGLGMDLSTKFGGALHFFLYDTVKIFLLLAVMIFAIGFIRTWLPQQRLKAWMSKGGMMGNFVAALFGAITPFCSCSSIPIFISLLKAGVPLGVTFSFLITSPIINELRAWLDSPGETRRRSRPAFIASRRPRHPNPISLIELPIFLML